MPSISSRPSASTMREPCVRATASGGARRLHLRIGQPDMGEPGIGTSRARLLSPARCRTFGASIPRSLPPFCPRAEPDVRSRMRSLDEFATAKLGELERRSPAPRARRHHPCDRNLGAAQRAPAAVVLLQRLSQPDPSPGRQGGGDRRRCAAMASAPAPRGWSPATIRCSPSSKRGSRAGRRPRPPACSAPAISPMSASSRRWSARDDLVLIDELAHACLWAGARLSGATVISYRHADVGHVEALLAERRRRHRARADRDRRRLLDGRRSRAAAGAGGAGAAPRCLADVGRCPRPRRGRRRARLELRARRRRPTSRCRWARSPRRSAPMAAISAPPPR